MSFQRLFSSATAEAIRQQRSEGATLAELAERHGASQLTIRRIVQGERYQDAGGPITPPRWTWRTLSDADVRAIREARSRGALLAPLAEQYGVSQAAISYIVNGKTHAGREGAVQR